MAAPALAAPLYRPDDGELRRAALIEEPAAFAADVLGLIGDQDSTLHPYAQSFLDGPGASPRDAHADLLHFLCILHGRQPSVVEVAEIGLSAKSMPVIGEWLAQAGLVFERERQWLAQLVVAAGPPPALARLTTAEQVVRAQRDAMLTLAGSDRAGCAFGAAVALLLDWHAIRSVLAASERRVRGETTLPASWAADAPSRELTCAALAATAGTAATRRALLFGVSQMLTQHRALWDLLEARQLSRV